MNNIFTNILCLVGLVGVFTIPILWIVKKNSAAYIKVEVRSISNSLDIIEAKASQAYTGPAERSPDALPLLEGTAGVVERAAEYDLKKGKYPLLNAHAAENQIIFEQEVRAR